MARGQRWTQDLNPRYASKNNYYSIRYNPIHNLNLADACNQMSRGMVWRWKYLKIQTFLIWIFKISLVIYFCPNFKVGLGLYSNWLGPALLEDKKKRKLKRAAHHEYSWAGSLFEKVWARSQLTSGARWWMRTNKNKPAQKAERDDYLVAEMQLCWLKNELFPSFLCHDET